MQNYTLGAIQLMCEVHHPVGTVVAQWLRCCATNQKVQSQMVSLEFFINIILPIALWP